MLDPDPLFAQDLLLEGIAGRPSPDGITVLVLQGLGTDPEALLTWQQIQQFGDRCTIYRRTVNPNSDGRGKPGRPVWAVVARNVPYEHASTRNFSSPSAIGRIIQPSSITVELCYFAIFVDIRDQDVIVNTTSESDALTGSVFRILGSATRFTDHDEVDARIQYVEARFEPKPPLGLPA